MIEVEKKFLLSSAEQSKLLEDATLLSEKTVEDSYFDADDYSLTTRDMWLRRRDGAFELKAPLEHSSESETKTHRYHEITDTILIAERLKLPSSDDFAAALSLAGIEEFVTSLTSRQSYKKQGFRIDVDSVAFRGSDFTYNLAEIELLVSTEAEAEAAEQRIIEFAKEHHLDVDQKVQGKIIALLRSQRPEHYAALVRNGVVSE